MARTRASSHIRPTMVAASPVTTLKTPAGRPARSPSSASASADSGVSDEGCATIVQPAASAAAALRVSMADGKIPRRDDADDAERLAPHHHLGVRQMAGDALGVEAFCLLGIPFDEGGGVVDLAKRFRQRLALFQRHQQRQIVLGGDDQLEPFPQDCCALLRQQPRARPERRARQHRSPCSSARHRARQPRRRLAPVAGSVTSKLSAGLARRPVAVDIGELAQQPAVGEPVERVVAVLGVRNARTCRGLPCRMLRTRLCARCRRERLFAPRA